MSRRQRHLHPSVERAIRRQHPDLQLGELEPKNKNRRVKELLVCARRVGQQLHVLEQSLSIWLDGFRLRSVNAVIGSGRKSAQESAKREAQRAVWSYTGPLWKFERRVDVTFVQFARLASKVTDSDNLYTKHLLDALTHAGGLGVIHDDNPTYVRFVTRGSNLKDTNIVGVRIDIVPVAICNGCGCTDDNACEGGCFWVAKDLCSRCADKGDLKPGDSLGF